MSVVRLFVFKLRKCEELFAAMNWKEAKKFRLEGQELLKRQEADPTNVKTDEWNERMLTAVLAGLIRAQAHPDIGSEELKQYKRNEWNREILENYDPITLQAMYIRLLQESGLHPRDGQPELGEVTAA